MAADEPPLKTLVVDVHNDRDFTGSDSQAARHLRTVLGGIEPTCRDLGWEPVAATYEETIRLFSESQRRE
jgi:ABC-type cobalt transport system substrate-binding protein